MAQASEARYSINDIVRTFGLSRTTIMYYESIGLVTPERVGEQDRRAYSDADVFRLMSAVTLKNVGIAPKDMAGYLDGPPFTVERCDEYAARIERDIAYQQAKLERIRLYGRLCENVGRTLVTDVQPYYFCPDRADTGYRHFPADDALDLLIAHMPLGGLGSRFDGDVLSDEDAQAGRGRNRWGRTVPVRYAGLIEGLSTEGLDVIGGCRCLVRVILADDIRRGVLAVQLSDAGAGGAALRARMRETLRERGLRAAGALFCPLSLPSDRGFVVPTCLPVEPAR